MSALTSTKINLKERIGEVLDATNSTVLYATAYGVVGYATQTLAEADDQTTEMTNAWNAAITNQAKLVLPYGYIMYNTALPEIGKGVHIEGAGNDGTILLPYYNGAGLTITDTGNTGQTNSFAAVDTQGTSLKDWEEAYRGHTMVTDLRFVRDRLDYTGVAIDFKGGHDHLHIENIKVHGFEGGFSIGVTTSSGNSRVRESVFKSCHFYHCGYITNDVPVIEITTIDATGTPASNGLRFYDTVIEYPHGEMIKLHQDSLSMTATLRDVFFDNIYMHGYAHSNENFTTGQPTDNGPNEYDLVRIIGNVDNVFFTNIQAVVGLSGYYHFSIEPGTTDTANYPGNIHIQGHCYSTSADFLHIQQARQGVFVNLSSKDFNNVVVKADAGSLDGTAFAEIDLYGDFDGATWDVDSDVEDHVHIRRFAGDRGAAIARQRRPSTTGVYTIPDDMRYVAINNTGSFTGVQMPPIDAVTSGAIIAIRHDAGDIPVAGFAITLDSTDQTDGVRFYNGPDEVATTSLTIAKPGGMILLCRRDTGLATPTWGVLVDSSHFQPDPAIETFSSPDDGAIIGNETEIVQLLTASTAYGLTLPKIEDRKSRRPITFVDYSGNAATANVTITANAVDNVRGVLGGNEVLTGSWEKIEFHPLDNGGVDRWVAYSSTAM